MKLLFILTFVFQVQAMASITIEKVRAICSQGISENQLSTKVEKKVCLNKDLDGFQEALRDCNQEYFQRKENIQNQLGQMKAKCDQNEQEVSQVATFDPLQGGISFRCVYSRDGRFPLFDLGCIATKFEKTRCKKSREELGDYLVTFEAGSDFAARCMAEKITIPAINQFK